MITLRRELLDQFLNDSIPMMKGNVLDVGGYKNSKRGRFRPPSKNVESWLYLNSNPQTEPDLCCSAENIPLNNESMNTVIFCEVLEYLENPCQVLREIYRVLLNDGVCLMTVPFLHPIHGDHWVDRKRFTMQGLKELCCNAGFRKVVIHEMGSIWTVIYDMLHVALGYASEHQDNLRLKFLRKMLLMSKYVFRYLDRFVVSQKKYITSGYFVVLEKS